MRDLKCAPRAEQWRNNNLFCFIQQKKSVFTCSGYLSEVCFHNPHLLGFNPLNDYVFWCLDQIEALYLTAFLIINFRNGVLEISCVFCGNSSTGVVMTLMVCLISSLRLCYCSLIFSRSPSASGSILLTALSDRDADGEDDPVIWRDWIGLFCRSALSHGRWWNWWGLLWSQRVCLTACLTGAKPLCARRLDPDSAFS